MLLEQLQARQVMAADIFDTQETVAVGSLSPVPQIAQAVGMTPVDVPPIVLASEQAFDSQVARSQLTFTAADARPIGLEYSARGQNHVLPVDKLGVHFVEHEPANIDLSQYVQSTELDQLQVTLVGTNIFSVLPTIDNGHLQFQVSSKPGLITSSTLLIHDAAGRPVYAFDVLVNNLDGNPHASSSLASENEWITETTRMRAEGEGPEALVINSSGTSSGSSSGSGSFTGNLTLSATDGTAEEPHLIYCEATPTTGTIQFARTNWGGGAVWVQLSGSAKFGIDYALDNGSTFLDYDSINKRLLIDVPSGNTPYFVILVALQDGAEPGQTDFQGDVDQASENAKFEFVPNQSPNLTGTADVTITDLAEGVTLTANPSSTSELGPPPGVFSVKPNGSFTLCTSIRWQVKDADTSSGNEADRAQLGSDYSLSDELIVPPLMIPDPFGFPDPLDPLLHTSNDRPLSNEADFQMFVSAVNDGILEGPEIVEARVEVPALRFTSSFSTVTITEEYLDAKTEKDEESGCSCTCTTCSDGNSIQLKSDSSSGTVTTADGMVTLRTDGQNGQNPVVYVGLKLPGGKAVPSSIDVQLQVIEQRTNSSGQLVGLGRQLAANSTASPNINLVIPAGVAAGTTLWFALQADLSAQVASWTRGSGSTPGSSGVTEKIVPLELLANANFASGVPTNQMYSGWVGRTNHAMRDENASSLAPGVGKNVAPTGIDRMLRNQNLMVADAAPGGNSGGKIKLENGSMLFRANGGTSWFQNSSQPSPESQDTLAGDLLTDRYGNKKRFNALGDMIETTDASGNITSYVYAADGGISSITDARGQQTTFTRYTDVAGNQGIRISRINTGVSTNNRTYDLIWQPFNFLVDGQLRVTHDDPDGTGPRVARQDVFTYSPTGYLTSIATGAINAPTHFTTLSHNNSPDGDRRLASVTYPDGSSVTLDLARQRNSLITSSYSGGPILTNDPRALVIDPVGTTSTMPNYAAITYLRSSSSDRQRTIVQLDHRGRVLRSWDPVQVAALGLDGSGTPWNSTTFQTLQANIDLSSEYSRQPTQRDTLGRITGTDYGEALTLISPDPDKIVGGINGPLSRQTVTLSYVNNNPVTQQQPIQAQETFAWNDAFDVLTEAKDATGNRFYQTVNPSTGLVTQQRWEQSGFGPAWQNPANSLDVNADNFVSPIDALLIINYLNSVGAGTVPNSPAPPYLDTNGDNFISPIDSLLVINYLNSNGTGTIPPSAWTQPTTIGQIDYTYSTLAGIPNDLVTQTIVRTGRASGDLVTNYVYFNVPTNRAVHGKLQSITEVQTGATATTSFTYDNRGNLNRITDPAGRQTKMWYDRRDRMIARLTPDPDGSGPLLPVLMRYDYDVFDNVISTELINARIEGTLTLVTALTTSYTYDNANRVTSVINQNPNTQWYLTNGTSGITRSTTKPTVTTNITQAILESYALANSPIPNAPITSTTLQGLRTNYEYFATGNVVRVIETNAGTDGRETRITYDRLDRVNKVVAPAPVTGATAVAGQQLENGGAVTRYEYDNLGNTTKVTDALSNSSTYTYDALNRLIKLSSPNPAAPGTTLDTSLSYLADPRGWRVTSTSPVGQVINVQTDMLGRTLDVNGAVPKQTFAYWLDGLTRSVTDELARTTDYNYDQRGRLISMAAPPAVAGGARSTTSFQYTVDNLLTKVIDPLLRETTTSYDLGGRVSLVTQPDPDGVGPDLAAFNQVTRDSLGNVLTSSDGSLAPASRYTYDAWFRVLTATDAKNATTTKAYDVFGNVTSITDPLSNQTRYTYNKRNELVNENKPVNGVNRLRSYSYDAVGNLRRMVNRNSLTTTWNYDTRYRPTSESWSTGRVFSYTYDGADRLTGITDSDPLALDFQYAYDSRSQLQLESQSGSSLINRSVIFDRDFDQVGNRTKLEANIGGTIAGTAVSGGIWDFQNVYAYDGMDRLSSVSQSNRAGGNMVAPKLATYAYDAASQLTDLRRYSSTTVAAANLEVHTRNSFDAAGRLRSITHSSTELGAGQNWNGSSTPTGTMLAGYFLTYDRDNRITSFSSFRDAFRTSYTYDTVDQLTGATTIAITGMVPAYVPPAEGYTLDNNGNRMLNATTSTSAVGTQNQIQSDGTNTYTYDNEGNITRRTNTATGRVTDYTWDVRNRLTSVTERVNAASTTTYLQKTEYIYDAFDNRIAKRFDANGSDAAPTWDRYEAFVWADGQTTLRLVDSDGAGLAQGFRLANRYLYGEMVDQLLADEQFTGNTGWDINSVVASTAAGNTLWALTDHLGSVRDVSDNNGIVRQHLVFDSFGRRLLELDYNSAGTPIASTSPDAVDELFGYTGRDWDADVGLQYNRARWYDPNTGRWLSRDPIGFEAGDANLYRYVGNGPTNATDPSGLVEEPEREKGHKKGNNPEKHSQAEHARRLQQQNAIRRMAQESKNDVVNDALKHIDVSIEECEDARKTAERKMLKASSEASKHAEEMARLSRSIESLKEIELIVENSEIVDVKNLDDLTEEAMEKLTKAGRWQIGKKVFGAIPYIGALGITVAQADNVEAKGFYFGTLQTGLENVPIVEWVMLAGGEKCIPSDKDAIRWYQVISQPVKHVDDARRAIQAVDSPGFFNWFDDLLRPLDYLRGNW